MKRNFPLFFLGENAPDHGLFFEKPRLHLEQFALENLGLDVNVASAVGLQRLSCTLPFTASKQHGPFVPRWPHRTKASARSGCRLYCELASHRHDQSKSWRERNSDQSTARRTIEAWTHARLTTTRHAHGIPPRLPIERVSSCHHPTVDRISFSSAP